MALTFEEGIAFEILNPELPKTLACDVVDYNNDSITMEASLSENRYVIYLDEKARKKTCFIKFSVHDKHFTAIVQHVQQIDGLSRTPTQRKLNESIAAITTDIPDIGHFVDCISNILDATEKIAIESSTKGSKDKGKGGKQGPEVIEGGALSTSITNHSETKSKPRLTHSDDMGFVLDVLLYNLRDENPDETDLPLAVCRS